MAKILVVDDARVMRFHISKLLKALGHTVVAQAKDGYEALEAYKKYQPDLVTMDVEMPPSHNIQSGAQAVKEIIQFDSLAIVIMISSKTHKDNVSQALNNGARNYINKPVTSEKLEELITHLGLS